VNMMVDVGDISPTLQQEGHFGVQFSSIGLLPLCDFQLVDTAENLQPRVFLAERNDIVPGLNLKGKDSRDSRFEEERNQFINLSVRIDQNNLTPISLRKEVTF